MLGALRLLEQLEGPERMPKASLADVVGSLPFTPFSLHACEFFEALLVFILAFFSKKWWETRLLCKKEHLFSFLLEKMMYLCGLKQTFRLISNMSYVIHVPQGWNTENLRDADGNKYF